MSINNSICPSYASYLGQPFKQDSALQTGHVKQSNHFACNFAKCVPILKILSPANRTNDNSVLLQDHHTLNVQLHYLVIYCYHYIRFRLSLFSDINVSQRSVATFVRCGMIFNPNFIANLLTSRKSKRGDVLLRHSVQIFKGCKMLNLVT